MSGFLTPDEFKTREQFERLSESDRDAYQERRSLTETNSQKPNGAPYQV